MGLFDFFKTPKSQPATSKSDKEQFYKILDEIVKEIGKSYNGFFTDMSRLLEECSDRKARVIRIGLEIPTIAYFDFENFNNLLFNYMHLEIKDKRNVFFQEQCTFYVLFSDRYLFSKLGNEDRNQVMDVLERAYLNKILNMMMDVADYNKAVKICNIYEKHILKRENETLQCGSIAHFLTFYQAKLIPMLGLENEYLSVRLLLAPILDAGTLLFTMHMLSTL